jgi:hypothetical protein
LTRVNFLTYVRYLLPYPFITLQDSCTDWVYEVESRHDQKRDKIQQKENRNPLNLEFRESTNHIIIRMSQNFSEIVSRGASVISVWITTKWRSIHNMTGWVPVRQQASVHVHTGSRSSLLSGCLNFREE